MSLVDGITHGCLATSRCQNWHRHRHLEVRRRLSCLAKQDGHTLPERPEGQSKAISNRRGRPSQVNGSAEPDRFRLSASASASPALDGSGGDLPPTGHNTKAVGEDDDDSQNNSAEEIESLLAKV